MTTTSTASPLAETTQTGVARFPALMVFEYHLANFRRSWYGSVFSSFLMPVLTLVGFGVGVGSFVTGGVAGVPYLDYLVPGLIASTAFQVAIGESLWPVFGRFEWDKTYFAQAAASLRVGDILGGQLLFLLFRVLLSATIFLAVAAAFGTLHSLWSFAVLPVQLLLGLAVISPVIAYTARVSSDSFLALLMRFGVIPATLFSGVFFPVAELAPVLRALAYASPLWHAVELSRSATLGVAPYWPVAGHLLYLAAWAAVGWWLARRQFTRRLVD